MRVGTIAYAGGMPLVSLLTVALMIVALVDIIRRDDAAVRFLPKLAWIIIVILLPLIGSILWFAIGRDWGDSGIRLPQPRQRERETTGTVTTAPAPRDVRTTEQQIADLDREIEEWRLREEIEKRKRARGDSDAGAE